MAKRVDFYLIPETSVREQWRFACRLTAKLFEKGKSAYLLVSDDQEARQLDDLLWTFSDISFVPHHLSTMQTDEPAPIQIGFEKPTHATFDILINLTNVMIDEFDYVIEIIPEEETLKTNGRKRYQQYKNQKFTIKTHDLRK